MKKNPTELWKEILKLQAYEHHCHSASDLKKTNKLGWAWRRILRVTQIIPPAKLFELGSGGGRNLVALALKGFPIHGIDVSPNVVERAKHFIQEVKEFQAIKATIEVADILEYETQETYDMCFHVGVVEHFLEDGIRQSIWKKLYDFTKPGGWIVSIVPCGMHIMRNMIRTRGLAGYQIPEIDYSCGLHRKEFIKIGLSPVIIKPHNFFGFLNCHPNYLLSKFIAPMLIIFGNLLLPQFPIKEKIKEKLAHTILACGRRPE